MRRMVDRRKFLWGTAAAAALPWMPAPAVAQSAAVRIGLLTVKTGPLAQGGIQMEQGITVFLKEKNNTLAGRKVELISADTGGNPAGAKTKAQELVERDNVDFIVGPLAAFELLAITNYVQQAKIPLLSLAAADDMTQRKPNPYFVRASATSSQCCQPLGDYAAKEMKLKRVATINEDFAFGYEQVGGFQKVFEDEGGRVVKKLWTPIVTPDYTPYLAQLADIDGVWNGFAGSNPIKFNQQYAAFGLKDKYPRLGGWTAYDDALLKSFGDDAIGAISAAWYSSDLDTPSNKRFVADMVRDYGGVPGGYAAGLYINGMCIEAALKKTGGKTDDKQKLIEALRAVSLTDTPRGAFHFDHLGNVVGNVFIRRLDRKDGKLVNTIVKTYPNVSQFFTYGEKEFLAQPVYSRDYPPLKS
ncbi:MAG TPA: ABC transporter substrate-binding protein [Stellaceae bacterium]|nr:ABC transporter substrate-binding protein [Stellaceae bacterium]